MTTTAEPPSLPQSGLHPRSFAGRKLIVSILLILALFGGGGLVARSLGSGTPHAAAVPQSSAMESTYGVRFTRLAVVGDGGLLVLSYVVIDAEKAQRLQADRNHPPALSSEARTGGTKRVSLMRTGHAMRAGSTYYFVYQNTAGAIRSGEAATIRYGGVSLRHVPVL
ncbi:MAG TPA: hypothetical protein VFL99_09655 [Segeticoccus sp.]|uniref:hypothetical protein n=1 Tax=Segeticoccus sp. TaxID=2706531 RepID=UPI002D7FCE40|nr:hypothetical protein [Segeticoccus sp.]HET8600579.1 hypothetical protein [Segeticoccus sp.]